VQLTTSESLRSLREALAQEHADRTAADDAISQSWRLALDRERSDWTLANMALRSLVNALEKDIVGINDVLVGVHQRLLELERLLIDQAVERQKTLEHEVGGKAQQRLAELSLRLDMESDARAAQAEEVRRVLRTLRQKMGSELAHQAEFSRSTRNEVYTKLQDLRALSPLDMDRVGVEDQLLGQQAACEVRLCGLEAGLQAVKHCHRHEQAVERQHHEEIELKQSEAFAAQLLELRSDVYARLCQERDLQQARVSVLQERLNVLEVFFQEARALLLRSQS